MLENYLKHKDAKPIDTINRIRNILYDLGFTPHEHSWYNSFNSFYSTRIITTHFEDMGQNGKGLTPELALASGYSEFMERLQNLILIKKQYGLMKDFLDFPDAKIFSKKEFLAQTKENILKIISKEKDENILNEYKDTIKCYPYFNAFENKSYYLPESILGITGSNGMCAGNSPQEAIIQGICEIFERFSVRYIYENNLKVPTIPIEDIKNLGIYPYVKKVQDGGYSVVIKDCTLDGFIPVLAVCVFNKDFSKCLISFGSDPNFEVTLMRCISEAFQGFNTDGFEHKMINLDLTDNDSFTYSKNCPDDYQMCKFAKDFILSNNKPNYTSAFEQHRTNNDTTLNFIINKLKSKNYELYVRDVSFLNYPSYHIFIPGMSEYYDFDYAYSFTQASSVIRKTLLKLKKQSNKDIELCIDAIHNFLEHPFNKFMYAFENGSFVKDFSALRLSGNSDLFSMNLEYLLSLLYYKLENYDKAFDYLNQHLNKIRLFGQFLGNIDYYRCVLYYFRLKALNMDSETILNSLKNIFGTKIANEVFDDLKNPDKVFDNMKLPSCGDCSTCEVNNECYYENWKLFINKLSRKMQDNPIDQMKLSHIFQS